MVQKTAKEIYFDNFGSLLTMKRNGEYRDYSRKKVSLELEREWSLEIKEILVNDIISNGDFLKLVPLTRVNLPENEIIESFKIISSRCSNSKIRENLERLKNLISPDIYERIIGLFK